MQSAAVRRYEYEETEGTEQTGNEQAQEQVEEQSQPPLGEVRHLVVQGISNNDISPAGGYNFEYVRRLKKRPFMRVLLLDVLHHWYFYCLCLILCAVCVFKVYQVQQTRQLTAELNELAENNDDLSNEWLGLLAKKQALEKQSVIREAAMTKLNMIQPRTEAEIVIRLDR